MLAGIQNGARFAPKFSLLPIKTRAARQGESFVTEWELKGQYPQAEIANFILNIESMRIDAPAVRHYALGANELIWFSV
jgi:hypothetical protein